MDEQQPTENDFSSSIGIAAIRLRQHINQSIALIWLDTSFDASEQDYQDALTQFQRVIGDVTICAQRDEAIDYLTKENGQQFILVLENVIGQQMLPMIHDIPQLKAVYMFSNNSPKHEQWTNEWIKIKGIHDNVEAICEALKLAVKHNNQDSIAMSFVTTNEGASDVKLNELEPSFMYTLLLKETLLEMKYDKQSIKKFTELWRLQYANNIVKLNDINEFESDYCTQTSIKWYTRERFLYETLNHALRTLETSFIIDMGFFITDLHQQISELNQKQFDNYGGKPFTVYRGQGLSKPDFEKLLRTKGRLISFDNFLSTSADREVSFGFAMGALTGTDTIGILFKMTIDPSVSSTPFASIRDVSQFQTEEEVLFSMHTVFRVGEITKIDTINSMYEVDLQLTPDNDQELRILTKRIREEVKDQTEWSRLGLLLLKIDHFVKAEELYNLLLERTFDLNEKAAIFNNLGYIKTDQGDYEKAQEMYKKAAKIWAETFPPNHLSMTTAFSNIGTLYNKMGQHWKALDLYRKALESCQKTRSINHPSLATCYNNLGLTYVNIGECTKAQEFFKKALDIWKEILPPNHPDLATCYNNIGSIYENFGEHSKALEFYEKTLQIRQKTLPPNHPLFIDLFLQQYCFDV